MKFEERLFNVFGLQPVKIVNNLHTTEPGYALDARMGTYLYDNKVEWFLPSPNNIKKTYTLDDIINLIKERAVNFLFKFIIDKELIPGVLTPNGTNLWVKGFLICQNLPDNTDFDDIATMVLTWHGSDMGIIHIYKPDPKKYEFKSYFTIVHHDNIYDKILKGGV